MANDKNFKIKNGLSAVRYLGSNGVATAGSTAYSLGNAIYAGISFSATSQETDPRDVAFNNEGTKMYIIGSDTDSVYQYSLSTAFDISTASYDSVSFSVGSQENYPLGFTFSNDGAKMYVVGFQNDTVYQYSLSTAFNLSTASYDSVSFALASQDTSPNDIAFNNDGTKMYVAGDANNSIYQYSLSTAYNVGTASYDAISFSVGSQEPNINALSFNNDGTKLFIVGNGNDTIYQYSLSTAFDISTASYDSVSFSVASQESEPKGFAISHDGTKMYIAGDTNDGIYQYSTVSYTQTLDLSTGNYFSFTPSGATTVSFTGVPASGTAVSFAVEVNGDGSAITWPTSVKWHLATAPTATANKELYTFVTTDGGTTVYGKKAAEGLA